MIDIWPELSASPILTHFGWSPLVELAFDTNRDMFLPSLSIEPYLTSLPYTTNADRYAVIPGLMALHLRRGDFAGHCEHLAGYPAEYNAFSSFPDLPDPFVPPRGPDPDENRAAFRAHCYPTLEQIVQRVRELRRTHAARGLRKLYIMTNADEGFVRELREALWRDQDWQMISSSRDLVLNWEQRHVAQAVDMLVGQRAQVFVGNGVRARPSLVVLLQWMLI